MRACVLCCLLFFRGVFGQQRNDLAFASESATIDPSFIKTFDISVNLNLTTGVDVFNDTILQQVARTYFVDTLNVGIPLVSVEHTSAGSNVSYTASYNVSYNYTTLEGLSNTDIINAVNNSQFVQTAFENDTLFNSTFIWAGQYSANGNSICPSAQCNTYATCTDEPLGNYVICQSNCVVQQLCYNNAYCVQANGTIQPHCSCVSSANNWFVGENCKTMLNLWMPIVYFVVVFLLIMLVILVTCYCMKGIEKKLEKEKRKAFIKASKEREQPMSKNQKVFVTIKSALGLKKSTKFQKEKSEDQEPTSKAPKDVTPPNEEAGGQTPPMPAPRTRIASSQESTHEPTSSSSSSSTEDNYAAMQFPPDTDEEVRRSRGDSFSSSEENEDERYRRMMEERLAALPPSGAEGAIAPPYAEPVAYAVVNKRPREPTTQALESTV